MSRPWVALLLLLVLRVLPAQAAPTIPEGDLQFFGSGCSLAVLEGGSSRSLTWPSVAGASSYKVGYRECNGTIVGLAEVTGVSYTHTGWSPNACLEYICVAYDSSGNKICAGHCYAGNSCPCP